jgi:RNA recognition motif-containing protein
MDVEPIRTESGAQALDASGGEAQSTVAAGKPRGYAFIEYEHKNDMKTAYKMADGRKVEGRRVVVDVERGRTVPNWWGFIEAQESPATRVLLVAYHGAREPCQAKSRRALPFRKKATMRCPGQLTVMQLFSSNAKGLLRMQAAQAPGRWKGRREQRAQAAQRRQGYAASAARPGTQQHRCAAQGSTAAPACKC